MERAPSKAALIGARLVRLFSRPRRITTRVTRFHALLIRISRGRVQRSWLFALGLPVMSITTIGRRSSKSRTTTVAYFYDHGELVTSAANLGSERDPAWALNLKANPQAEIVIEGKRHRVRARLAEGEDRSRLWSHWVELQPPAEAAQAIAGREIPLFVLEPVDGDAIWVREQRHTTSRARPGRQSS
jgi:deazaflavin-dependent oxidoreductase (nitroreductase family)